MQVEARSWLCRPGMPDPLPLGEQEILLRWAVTAVTERGWLVEGAVLTGPGGLIGQREEAQGQDKGNTP